MTRVEWATLAPGDIIHYHTFNMALVVVSKDSIPMWHEMNYRVRGVRQDQLQAWLAGSPRVRPIQLDNSCRMWCAKVNECEQ